MSKNDITCIDIETTSLDPTLGSVIQIGGIRINSRFALLHDAEFMTYCKPLDSFRDPSAMNVNNIPEELLTNSISLNDALETFENFCGESKTLAAWGAYFDIPFLKKQYEKINRPWPFSHVTIDLKSIVKWELAKQNMFTNGLTHTLDTLNLTSEGISHDALVDIKNTIKILSTFSSKLDIRTIKKGW